MATPDLIWACVRNNSSFLVKRKNDKHVQLTKEPGNVSGKNSFKYSGLANKKTIDLNMDSNGVVQIGLKAPKRANMPSTQVRSTPLKKDFRRVAHSIKSQTAGQHYRADLTDMALARWSKLYRVSMIKKGLKKPKPVKKGRTSKQSSEEDHDDE
mmetsp:Transcript_7043/g.9878  ORF Transcript_7043/g.9878 Transcript_7043/m.9878 type:complete len:154 (-) Transcript_7043:347-808(-)